MDADHIDAIRKAVAGDLEGLEQVFRSHTPRVLAYIQKHLPERVRQDVEPGDVLQDVFFEACRRIKEFSLQGEPDLLAWLIDIARSRMIDLLQAARARAIQEIAISEDDVPHADAPPLSLYFSADEFSAAEIATIIAGISALYVSIGGDEILIDDVTVLDPEGAVVPAGGGGGGGEV